jgi:hypothetical protein
MKYGARIRENLKGRVVAARGALEALASYDD